jgi:hypothetical protein
VVVNNIRNLRGFFVVLSLFRGMMSLTSDSPQGEPDTGTLAMWTIGITPRGLGRGEPSIISSLMYSSIGGVRQDFRVGKDLPSTL